MLRSALIIFFEIRKQSGPERLADEAIRRVARAIGQGIEIGDPNHYTLAVARHLLREPDQASSTGSPQVPAAASDSSWNNPAANERLKTCLNQLPFEDLALLKRYYYRKSVRRKDHRERLAHQLGISTRTLLGRISLIQKAIDERLLNLPN